jgi:hypothetical protein
VNPAAVAEARSHLEEKLELGVGIEEAIDGLTRAGVGQSLTNSVIECQIIPPFQ